jgi:hypothetical protein
MVDKRSGDPLTESGIDRELRTALTVEPSPEFMARVRSRVAHEAMANGLLWRPIPVVLAIATVILICLGIARLADLRAPTVAREPVRAAPERAAAAAVEPPARRTVVRTRRLLEESRRAKRGPSTIAVNIADRAAEPPVLVPAAEQKALHRLFTRSRGSALRLTYMSEPEFEVTDARGLEIPPITIDPLVPEAPAEGVHQ